MKIILDRAICCGNLECVRIAPALFAENRLGLGEVILESSPSNYVDAVRLAAESCPAGAITLEDDQPQPGLSRLIYQGDELG